MGKNKKNLIIVSVIAVLVLVYFALFNISPKKQDSLMAECQDRPINLDKLNLCLQDTQTILETGDKTQISGKLNECVQEMKNLYLIKSGYEIPDKIKTDFTFKGYFNKKIIEIPSKVEGIHIAITRQEKSLLSPCFMSVLDPKVTNEEISFIPNDAKNLIACLDPDSGDEFAYFSSDWGSEIEEELKKHFVELRKDLANRKLMNNVPPSNAVPSSASPTELNN